MNVEAILEYTYIALGIFHLQIFSFSLSLVILLKAIVNIQFQSIFFKQSGTKGLILGKYCFSKNPGTQGGNLGDMVTLVKTILQNS